MGELNITGTHYASARAAMPCASAPEPRPHAAWKSTWSSPCSHPAPLALSHRYGHGKQHTSRCHLPAMAHPTPIALAAHRAGSTVVGGLSTPLYQVARQVELQTNRLHPAPLAEMRDTDRCALHATRGEGVPVIREQR